MTGFDQAGLAARTRWRSLLFVPADNERALAKAAERGADALILDLEDAVADRMKAVARSMLGTTITMLRSKGQHDILVRVNATEDMHDDILAAHEAGANAIMLPKTEKPDDVASASAILDTARPHSSGFTGIVALLESPAAVLASVTIANAPRVVGLALGSEDFGLALGVSPAPANLSLPCQMLALAAATRSIAAIGLPVSLAGFADLPSYSAAAADARAMGLTGAMCIHPAQIKSLNDAFGESPTQKEWAIEILRVWAKAQSQGQNVASFEGSMIDQPVVARAKAIIARSR
jgi:citrate lyase subunit beta/citryl-CoA lyase